MEKNFRIIPRLDIKGDKLIKTIENVVDVIVDCFMFASMGISFVSVFM